MIYKKIEDLITGKLYESTYKVDNYKLENVLKEMKKVYS